MTTKQLVEQTTIKAGEMSWEDWQPHFERMSARDVCRFIERQDDDEINAFTVVMGDAFFPITLKQDFTYTQKYKS